MATTYLSKTFGSAGNRKKFTISTWLKRTGLGSVQQIMACGVYSSTQLDQLYFNDTDTLNFDNINTGGTATSTFISNAKFRDTSAWYHIVVKVDSTQASAGDRVTFYVNGSEISLATETQPSQNFDFAFNNNVLHNIGTRPSQSHYFDGSMTHFNFIDGTAYTPTSFGESDSVSGIWKPKTVPSVTYGNNGFFLKFENSGAMGTDSSGNSNTWSVGGGILTQNVDTPSNNFATINPNQNNIANLSNGNLTATTSNYQWGMSTLAVNSGKWYVEMKVTHACMIMGIQDIGKANDRLTVNNPFWTSGSQSYHLDGFSRVTHDSYGDIANDASAYPTYGNGDIIMMAVNLTDNKLAYGKNGTWYNSTNPGSGTTNMISIDAPSSNENGNYGFVFGDTCGASDGTFNVNFGQGFFGTTAVASANADANGHGAMEYAVPSGYYTLNTKNIKEFG